jgi:2-hydroxychromene-2-carboxylate isomerase
MKVDFFFGVGSRYSYLATARIDEIEARTGALVRWRVVYSPDLIRKAGSDPFQQDSLRGQYRPAYRNLDVARWANFLGIPYREPDFATADWRQIALWAVAAERLGMGVVFARAAFEAAFAEGRPPRSQAELAGLAGQAGLDPGPLAEVIGTGDAERALEHNLSRALAAGCFGVPSFVTEDGELFWGQDRIALLMHHLEGRQRAR